MGVTAKTTEYGEFLALWIKDKVPGSVFTQDELFNMARSAKYDVSREKINNWLTTAVNRNYYGRNDPYKLKGIQATEHRGEFRWMPDQNSLPRTVRSNQARIRRLERQVEREGGSNPETLQLLNTLKALTVARQITPRGQGSLNTSMANEMLASMGVTSNGQVAPEVRQPDPEPAPAPPVVAPVAPTPAPAPTSPGIASLVILAIVADSGDLVIQDTSTGQVHLFQKVNT